MTLPRQREASVSVNCSGSGDRFVVWEKKWKDPGIKWDLQNCVILFQFSILCCWETKQQHFSRFVQACVKMTCTFYSRPTSQDVPVQFRRTTTLEDGDAPLSFSAMTLATIRSPRRAVKLDRLTGATKELGEMTSTRRSFSWGLQKETLKALIWPWLCLWVMGYRREDRRESGGRTGWKAITRLGEGIWYEKTTSPTDDDDEKKVPSKRAAQCCLRLSTPTRQEHLELRNYHESMHEELHGHVLKGPVCKIRLGVYLMEIYILFSFFLSQNTILQASFSFLFSCESHK